MIPADLLAAERGIVKLLKAATQTGPAAWCRIVGTAADMATVEESQQTTPGLYVLYAGFAVTRADVYTAELVHRWTIVLALATPAASRNVDALNAMAGPYLSGVLKALMGATPDGAQQPMVLAGAAQPWHGEGKFSYFPVSFTTQAALCAAHT